MRKHQASRFVAEQSWGGPDLARFDHAVVLLRWISTPYHWHRNAGGEIFVVLDGVVEMHVRSGGGEVDLVELQAGDLLCLDKGEEHVAHPQGEARILVIEETQRV